MQIKKSFALTEVGDETIAVPIGDNNDGFHGIIRLNDTGVFIWNGLTQGLSSEQIAEDMQKKYTNIDNNIAISSINEIIEKLQKAGILE